MRQGQKGFAMVELIVVSAITAITAVGMSMTTIEIMKGSRRNNDLVTAIRQAQNAAYWLSQDALMSEEINIGDDTGTPDNEFIIANYRDWETADTYEIRYVWLNSNGSLKKLERRLVVRDKNGALKSSKTVLAADNIHSASFAWQNGKWYLIVQARARERTITREYVISQRVET